MQKKHKKIHRAVIFIGLAAALALCAFGCIALKRARAPRVPITFHAGASSWRRHTRTCSAIALSATVEAYSIFHLQSFGFLASARIKR